MAGGAKLSYSNGGPKIHRIHSGSICWAGWLAGWLAEFQSMRPAKHEQVRNPPPHFVPDQICPLHQYTRKRCTGRV